MFDSLKVINNYGITLGILMTYQIVTGLLLFYILSEYNIYSILQYNIYEVYSFEIIRAVHFTFCSVIFLYLVLHIWRTQFFYSLSLLLMTFTIGYLIYLLLVISAFIGYVLPFGQMSYWASIVILNLLYFIPYLKVLIIGSFIPDSGTLSRFFMIHFIVPFIAFVLILIHMYYLHTISSSDIYESYYSYCNFTPIVIYKDIAALLLEFTIIIHSLLLIDNENQDCDNNIDANTLVTPSHIIPEWYYLPLFCILKLIDSKIAGIIYLLIMFTLLIVFYNKLFSSYLSISLTIYIVAFIIWQSALLGAISPLALCFWANGIVLLELFLVILLMKLL